MYGLWTNLKNDLYNRRILRAVRPDYFVMSIGNLTWGGTGKTSLVVELARFLISKGLRVAIVSRGYRRNTSGPLLVSDGTSLKCSWSESGDEAYLHATIVPQAVVAVAEERTAALKLLDPFSIDVMVLDDGFQHRKIERDLDIVLLDASEDITRQKMIPFGKLREKPEVVNRASCVILTHSNHANDRTLRWVQENVNLPVFHANYVLQDAGSYNNKRIGAFCAIGSPHHFFNILREAGAELVFSKAFRDHHVFTKSELNHLLLQAGEKQADFVATTAKDYMRIQNRPHGELLKIAKARLVIKEDQTFYDWILNHLSLPLKHS